MTSWHEELLGGKYGPCLTQGIKDDILKSLLEAGSSVARIVRKLYIQIKMLSCISSCVYLCYVMVFTKIDFVINVGLFG